MSPDPDISSIAAAIGTERYGGAWIDGSRLHVAVVDLRPTDIGAVEEHAGGDGRSVTFHDVRYSAAELLTFFDEIEIPRGSVVISVGWEPRMNKVEVTLSRVDPDTVAYLRERIPSDALAVAVLPGSRVVGAEA